MRMSRVSANLTDNMAISIRRATSSDREACIGLLTAQLIEQNLPADRAGVVVAVDLALAPPSPGWLLLADLDGVAVGVMLANQIVSAEKYGSSLWVEELYVVPAARRRGVASALLDYIVAEGRRVGVRAVELEVVHSQVGAFALYRKLGFREEHRQRLTRDL